MMDWKEKGGKLEKEFGFRDFAAAMEFANSVAALSEKEDHHPDIWISYGKVRVSLVTHSEGKVTEKDRKLAGMVDSL